jgi:hypothetical protein
MSECKETTCGTETECKTAACKTKESECPSHYFFSECCCPVEKSIQAFGAAFPLAMREVQVEYLKARIKKAWGPQMEKQADAVIEGLGTFWSSLVATAKARKDLSEAFAKIFESSK